MIKKVMVLFLGLFLIGLVSSQAQIEYYYGEGCPHCVIVAQSEILERVNQSVSITKYETWYNVQNKNKFASLIEELKVPSNMRGVPFLFVNCSGKTNYLVGDQPIITKLEAYSKCEFDQAPKENLNWVYYVLGFIVIAGVLVWWMGKRRD